MQKQVQPWLVAVSGGPDSMALVSWCLEKKLPIALAHVNYHTRRQSNQEQALVEAFAKKHSLTCYVAQTRIPKKENLEAYAREVRYAFFEKLVKQHKYRGVLVAHQMDDLLETYFMQKEKHLVPETWGLKASGMVHGILVKRPLLRYTKAQLTQRCITQKIPYAQDASNQDLSYSRNRVRHQKVEKMCLLEKKEWVKQIHQENVALKSMRAKVKRLIQKGRVKLCEYKKLSQEERECLLRMLIEPKPTMKPRLSLKWIQEMDQICLKKQEEVYPIHNQWLILHEGNMWVMEIPKPYCFQLKSLHFQDYGFFKLSKKGPSTSACSVTKKDFPLTIRSWKSGDRIQMRFGTKSVSRFFIDRKIPLYQRKNWPIVLSCTNEVICVPGIGCNRTHFTIKPDFFVLQ